MSYDRYMTDIYPVQTFWGFQMLDKVVCPFLPVVKYFEIMMPIWHPTSEKALDELLDAKVDV